MDKTSRKQSPGRVRDAIVDVMQNADGRRLSVREIEEGVESRIGPTSSSSVRSYLNLNTPTLFVREERGYYGLVSGEQGYLPQTAPERKKPEPAGSLFTHGKARLVHADCFRWLAGQPENTFHAVVTDPPYGLVEYSDEQQEKLRNGKGGVWRIPPSFDGSHRAPLPRFTILTDAQLRELHVFFVTWGRLLLPTLVPGANVVVASNPLLSYMVSVALAEAGFERRGEIIRLVMTMRGGDRPKAAHDEFAEVSVMPRSMWEPWVLFRKRLDGRVQDNLRRWKTGGFRRPSEDRPFGDVIESSPTRPTERAVAPHPSLKPQAFLRQLVRGVLPLGEGIVLDPFAGSGSTLAAAESVGYASVGVERDADYFHVARQAIPRLVGIR